MFTLKLHQEVAGEGGHPQDEGQAVSLCWDGGLPVTPTSGWDEAKVWVKAKVLPYH